ncbi:MAG: CPBP family glutamic-type intramembrane protease [Gammaproteobacteria bacterium]|nr:CPBP family glutamic-type intramembrane protease [Gammaproteobacteria bacterium]
MSRNTLLIINGAALTGCAVFDYAWRTTLVTSLMLLLPFIDRTWSLPEFHINKIKLIFWSISIVSGILLVTFKPDYATAALATLVLTALPEEWFFRSYFMMRIERAGLQPYQANIITSLFFALLHLPAQGWFGLSVFIPSLIYGWIFQRTKDIVLVILLHALSNIVFFIYIRDYLNL